MAKVTEPRAVYTAHDESVIYDNLLRLEVKKRAKISNVNDVARIAAPKTAQILYNALRVGPRVVLRSAFELLRANTITRLLSAVVLLSIDTISLARGRISKKQFIINIVLALMLLVGGTAGWMLGQEVVSIILLENVVLGMIAGLAGAGILGALLGVVWEKIVKIFIHDDSEDMMDICNGIFTGLAQENLLTAGEIDDAKEQISITSSVLRSMFINKNRTEFAKEIIEPPVREVISRRGMVNP